MRLNQEYLLQSLSGLLSKSFPAIEGQCSLPVDNDVEASKGVDGLPHRALHLGIALGQVGHH